MFKKDGTPRFKYIVEGANLFFSEGARYLYKFRNNLIEKN